MRLYDWQCAFHVILIPNILHWAMVVVPYATGRASLAIQAKGDDSGKTGYPGPPGWGLGMKLTTPPHKKKYCNKTSGKWSCMDISAMTWSKTQRSVVKYAEQIRIKHCHLECSFIVWIDGVEEHTRKLGCRNWLVDAQDRGHWQHLL